jgi:cobalt-precorrin 5A hydrolase
LNQPFQVVIVAFTRRGAELASRLSRAMENSLAFAPERFASEGLKPMEGTVFNWAREWFSRAQALVFVSATGIAVRAIAPHVRDKTRDPAVVTLDDGGQNVISLLSGHLGGGNDLAKKIAALTGGQAIVTTATDAQGIEAADSWAVKNHCSVENPDAIKAVSASMLENLPVGVAITDEIFDHLGSALPWPVTLWLRPRVLVLGVGCKRGVEKDALDATVMDFLKSAGKSHLSLKAVASIDLKKDEPAILAFCREHSLPCIFFPAEELSRVEGNFSSSQKVLEVTGVDNVCERAAVLAANNGALLRSKTRYPGITLALALAREAVK